MDTKQAKDFLVQQTAKQAALENVPLSDLEKRMMYFTESEDATEDPIALNGEFEEKYDSDEFEAKISRLMRHAYKRVKKEDPETAREWDESVKFLETGDHYILLFCGQKLSRARSPRISFDSLKPLGSAIVAGVLLMGLFALLNYYGRPVGKSGRAPDQSIHLRLPAWLQHSLLALMVGSYVYYAILPWVLKKPPIGIGQLLLNLVPHKSKRNSAK